jgi:hypothetical protein
MRCFDREERDGLAELRCMSVSVDSEGRVKLEYKSLFESVLTGPRGHRKDEWKEEQRTAWPGPL